MRCIPTVFLATLAIVGQSQMAFSQQPISKGVWTFKNDKPERVTFDYGTELTVTLVLSVVVIGKGADQRNAAAVKRDLTKLQGTWELTRQVENGTVRSVKVIDGNKTTLRRFDPNGAIYWAHTSEFSIAITGSVRIFTFSNLEVTAGPQKGSKSYDKSSYIYRVDDETLVEARGLLIGREHEEPRIVVWKRVKADTAGR